MSSVQETSQSNRNKERALSYRDRKDLMTLFPASFFTGCGEERISRGDEGVATGGFCFEADLNMAVKTLSTESSGAERQHNTYDTSKFLLFAGHGFHDHLVLASSSLNSPGGSTPGRGRGSSPHNAGHSSRVESRHSPKASQNMFLDGVEEGVSISEDSERSIDLKSSRAVGKNRHE